MKKQKLPLSVFIVAKNEEERIGYTLDSVKDIADEIGVTREMIRQIKENSLKKLRNRIKFSTLVNSN